MHFDPEIGCIVLELDEEALTQALGQRAKESMTKSIEVPQLFALTRNGDDASPVVGYGMVLPDGSALSTSWPPHGAPSIYSAGSAEETAELRGAKLLWIGDES